MEPEGSCYPVHNGPPMVRIFSQKHPVHSNIILLSTPLSSEWSLQVFRRTFCTHLSVPCVLHDPPTSSTLTLSPYSMKRVSYEAPHCADLSSFPSLPPSYYLQHPAFNHPHSMIFFLSTREQVSHTYKTTVKIIVLYILIFLSF